MGIASTLEAESFIPGSRLWQQASNVVHHLRLTVPEEEGEAIAFRLLRNIESARLGAANRARAFSSVKLSACHDIYKTDVKIVTFYLADPIITELAL